MAVAPMTKTGDITTTPIPLQHGPYHRLKSPTQSDSTALKQHRSSEIWGRPRRDSDIPQVQAYVGPLPPNAGGIEFTTPVRPDGGTPPGQVRWTGPREGVVVEDGFAKIRCIITRNTQVLLLQGGGPGEGGAPADEEVTEEDELGPVELAA